MKIVCKWVLLSLCLSLLFMPLSVHAKNNLIEIFSVTDNQVIDTLPATEVIVDHIIPYINSIDHTVPNINPLKTALLLVKIPFPQSTLINTPLFQADINEVILVYTNNEEDDAFILLFDDEQQARFFYVKLNLADFYLENLLKISI